MLYTESIISHYNKNALFFNVGLCKIAQKWYKIKMIGMICIFTHVVKTHQKTLKPTLVLYLSRDSLYWHDSVLVRLLKIFITVLVVNFIFFCILLLTLFSSAKNHFHFWLKLFPYQIMADADADEGTTIAQFEWTSPIWHRRKYR